MVFEDSIAYISVTVLLTTEKHFNMERSSLVPTGQSDSVYAKQILCFKNVKSILIVLGMQKFMLTGL